MNTFDQLLDEIFEGDAEAVADDLPFPDAPGWDSLKHAQLIAGIEQRFGVDLSRDEISRMTTKRAARDVLAARGHDV